MATNARSLPIDQQLRRRLLPLLLCLLVLLVVGGISWRKGDIKAHHFEVATESARNIFRMIVLARQWNASHGGVYVFEDAKTQVNPYLEHPMKEIILADKRKLVMLNPAYMTRQISEMALSDASLKLRLHITSLNPIRPLNKADPWETEALKAFNQGKNEAAIIEKQAEGSFLRYMAPLRIESSCLLCHAKQGYSIGEIRGGISVSLPYDAIQAAINKELQAIKQDYIFFGILLMLVSWGLLELLARRWRSLDDTIELLKVTQSHLIENEKMASLGRMVAGFAHELNTPIGIAVGAVTHGSDILGALRTLVTQEDEVSETDLFQKLDNLDESQALAFRNLNRASELIQRFKRTSIDRESLQYRSYHLREVIDDLLMSMHNKLKHTQVEVQVECDHSIELYGVPGLVEQILENLISNSLTHAFDQGTRAGNIKLQIMRTDEDRVTIEFSDNGKGMSASVQQQVFEPFFTTNRAHGGSGLGLYLVYNLVTEQLGGSISLQSSLDSGTVFTIVMPLKSPKPEEAK